MTNILINIIAFMIGAGIGTVLINKKNKRQKLTEEQELMIYQIINDILSLDLKHLCKCENLQEFKDSLKQTSFIECNRVMVEDEHDVVLRSLISMKIENIIDNDYSVKRYISEKYNSIKEKDKYYEEETITEEKEEYEKTDISRYFY